MADIIPPLNARQQCSPPLTPRLQQYHWYNRLPSDRSPRNAGWVDILHALKDVDPCYVQAVA
ncbi:hypothetical protein CRW58_19970 [Salmonella enterica subsp. enterica serovar Newport]|nr:hypothetical protein [Salmonella enterica]EDL3488106.1 hypothetical protein [Salmonella enterica subsp. enterica serovar Newport]